MAGLSHAQNLSQSWPSLLIGLLFNLCVNLKKYIKCTSGRIMPFRTLKVMWNGPQNFFWSWFSDDKYFRIYHSDIVNVGKSPPLHCTLAAGKVLTLRNHDDSDQLLPYSGQTPPCPTSWYLPSSWWRSSPAAWAVSSWSSSLSWGSGWLSSRPESPPVWSVIYLYLYLTTSVSVEIPSQHKNCLLSIILFWGIGLEIE